MARKLTKSGFVTITEFARRIGVSQSAVSQAIQNGRIQAYGRDGESVPPGYVGKKFLDPAAAVEDWHNNRLRFD
jgi:hypothetical protein